MRRVKVAAAWLGLLGTAVLLVLLFLSVKAAAEDRERALDNAETAIADLRETRDAFRQERAQLHGQVDDLIDEVDRLTRQSQALREQVETLQRQVVDLGGQPAVDMAVAEPPPLSTGTRDSGATEPQPEPEPAHPGCDNGKGPKHCRDGG